MNLILEYPWWYVLLCLCCGALYAFVLYRKDIFLDELPKWIKYLLASLRFIAVSVIAFFLLNPLVKYINKQTQQPIIVLLQDNSSSIVQSSDSAFYKDAFKKDFEAFKTSLSEKYEVKSYSFDEYLKDSDSLDYKGKLTDLSEAFEKLYDKYSNQNLGAVVVATDGIINKGFDPVYQIQKLEAPVYAIALGDTAIKRDLFIKEIRYNKIAYLGNEFPLEISIKADKLAGKKSVLKISKDGKVLKAIDVYVSSSSFFTTVNALVEAEKSGVGRYTVELTPISGETNLKNNAQSIYIDVIDGRQKVLILAQAPHPDVSAIKQTIEANRNYEIKVSLLKDFSESVNQYNLIILHQVPGVGGNDAAALMQSCKQNNVPIWWISGLQSNTDALYSLSGLVKINALKNKTNEVQAVLDKSFSYFSISDETLEMLRKFPPLLSPFGDYKPSGNAVPFFNQRVGMLETASPLWVFSRDQNYKQALTIGDGLWKWKMYNYSSAKNHDAFNELVGKTVQYLSLKVDKSRFKVNVEKSFEENKEIIFSAELYNDSYEPNNEPEVTMEVKDENNVNYSFAFSKSGTGYRLNAGMLPVGDYKFKAQTKYNDKLMEASGAFTINPIIIENTGTVANHQLLTNLSGATGGKVYSPNRLEELKVELLNREDIKPVLYFTKDLKELIHNKWFFFLLLALLTLEWFVRKRNGAY